MDMRSRGEKLYGVVMDRKNRDRSWTIGMRRSSNIWSTKASVSAAPDGTYGRDRETVNYVRP